MLDTLEDILVQYMSFEKGKDKIWILKESDEEGDEVLGSLLDNDLDLRQALEGVVTLNEYELWLGIV